MIKNKMINGIEQRLKIFLLDIFDSNNLKNNFTNYGVESDDCFVDLLKFDHLIVELKKVFIRFIKRNPDLKRFISDTVVIKTNFDEDDIFDIQRYSFLLPLKNNRCLFKYTSKQVDGKLVITLSNNKEILKQLQKQEFIKIKKILTNNKDLLSELIIKAREQEE